MFARAYATSIRPIAFGRDLLAFIDAIDHEQAIPSSYTVTINTFDHEAFNDIESHLLRELAEAATQHCEQQDDKHDDPISVVFRVTDDIQKGTFLVSSGAVEAISKESVDQARNSAQIIAEIKPIVGAALILSTGQRIVLDNDTVKVGRQDSCRVVFNDSNVSREHAQLRRGPDGWMVLDLGSTNGTTINGQKILSEQLLINNDELAFGTSTARFEIS